jgi:hypothetical protein
LVTKKVFCKIGSLPGKSMLDLLHQPKRLTDWEIKMNRAELEQMLATAYAQRKQAYKLRCPKSFISAINHDIFVLSTKLAEVTK